MFDPSLVALLQKDPSTSGAHVVDPTLKGHTKATLLTDGLTHLISL